MSELDRAWALVAQVAERFGGPHWRELAMLGAQTVLWAVCALALTGALVVAVKGRR